MRSDILGCALGVLQGDILCTSLAFKCMMNLCTQQFIPDKAAFHEKLTT